MSCVLPKPSLDARPLGAHRLCVLTDDALYAACGVRIGFTARDGGVSEGAYASLNLGLHVEDDAACVLENRARLLEALGAPDAQLVVPNQVHGTNVVTIDSADPAKVDACARTADEGADALVVGVSGVAALLNFADCTPVVVVSPSGRFAVAHAGWRGAVGGVAGNAVRALCACDKEHGAAGDPASFNAYIGPHIRVECFETGADVASKFAAKYGAGVLGDAEHVNLAHAVSIDLVCAGIEPERIADARICTKCNSERYFSYRASQGVCGRHGAIALKR